MRSSQVAFASSESNVTETAYGRLQDSGLGFFLLTQNRGFIQGKESNTMGAESEGY
jgi:hypothetical protein